MTSNETRKVGLVTVFSLGVVSGEVSADFERPSRSHFSSILFSPTSHSRLAKEKGFATVCLFLKSDTNGLQNDARKVGHVVWAQTHPPPPTPKNEEYRSSFRTTGSCFRVNKTMSRFREFPCVFSSLFV